MTAVTPSLSSARLPCPSTYNTLSDERVSCSLSSTQTFRAHWQHGSAVFFPRSPGVSGYLSWGSPYYSGCLTHAALLGCPRQSNQKVPLEKKHRPVLPESVRDPHHAPSQAMRRKMGVGVGVGGAFSCSQASSVIVFPNQLLRSQETGQKEAALLSLALWENFL